MDVVMMRRDGWYHGNDRLLIASGRIRVLFIKRIPVEVEDEDHTNLHPSFSTLPSYPVVK
jgi:hypothetical protein